MKYLIVKLGVIQTALVWLNSICDQNEFLKILRHPVIKVPVMSVWCLVVMVRSPLLMLRRCSSTRGFSQ